jgi:Transposase DDE domain
MFNCHKDIKKALMEAYGNPIGKAAQRVEVLSCIINGIIKKGTCNIDEIAREMPSNTDFVSRVAQVKRWLSSKFSLYNIHYLPCLQAFLGQIGIDSSELVFIIDATDIGNGCTALMVSVIVGTRSIPVAWIVRKCKKGHCPQSMHLDLLQILHRVIGSIPSLQGKKVTLLGDGEFDGGDLTDYCQNSGWLYVVKTAKDTIINHQGEIFHFQDIQNAQHQEHEGHKATFLERILYTKQEFGFVNAVFWHAQGYEDPLYLLTNFDLAFDAFFYYKKRFAIETMFRDIKSSGFNIQLSKLDQPKELNSLLIAVCLAYLAVFSAGRAPSSQEIKAKITYKNREVLSVFSYGFLVWEYVFKFNTPILLSFSMNFCLFLQT